MALNEKFTIVDPVDGHVIQFGQGDNISTEPGYATLGTVLMDVNPTVDALSGTILQYYDGANLIDRPDFDADNEFANEDGWLADTNDTITYGPNLPNPTSIMVFCTHLDFTPMTSPYLETTGTFELTADLAGRYMIVFTAWPYLEKIVNVVANPKLLE